MAENIDVRTSLAMSKGAISVTDFATLASTQGVPITLDKGDNHVVVLFPTQCCNHHGSRAVPQMRHLAAAFDTSEHIITVAGCKLRTPKRTEDALMARLPVSPNLPLTYGQVIALGGDFYGDPDHPVCTAGSREQQVAQFQKNFVSLQKSEAEVKHILGIAEKYEFRPIAERVRKNQPPSGVYAGMPTTGPHFVPDEDREFDEATGGTWYKNGRYLNLAATNLDHFGEDAVKCWLAGHILAQQHAIQARKSGDPDTELRVAYAINAFADHFLTDRFSAGHMRTPRRHLYEYSSYLPAAASGLCTKGMHDEDNKFGLWVENERGDRWVAYGDARYRDWCNAANRKVMKAALQQSMDEVWNAFDHGALVTDNSEVLKFIPKPLEDARNWFALFNWKSDGYIYERNSLDNVGEPNYAWKTGAGLAKTAVALQLRKGPYMPQGQYTGMHYPPDEAGPSGEVGWPRGPSALHAYARVRGASGPDLHSVEWKIDAAPGPPVP